jgi:AcrR family transcriptional regulator
MSMLAKRFSVGVMTLYSYFSGRDALLIAVADEIYSRFECSVQGGPWQYQVREWLWTTVRLFERYPVAMQLSLWDGQASPGWLRTWIPLIELIKGQGLEGPQLAFAARWFTTSSLGFITSQPPPHTGRVTGHLDALTSREAILLQDLQLDMVEVDADAALTYGFTHIIAGLERIIAEANGISAGPKGIQDHE